MKFRIYRTISVLINNIHDTGEHTDIKVSGWASL